MILITGTTNSVQNKLISFQPEQKAINSQIHNTILELVFILTML